MLTIQDKRYIQTAIHTALEDTNRYFGVVLDQIKHEGQLTRELLETRPTRVEVDGKIENHVTAYHRPFKK